MARRRYKPELIQTVPVRYIKPGDQILTSDGKEVVVEDAVKIADHWNVRFNGRDHYYGNRSKIERLENPI